jgi:hypothetical protein
VEETTVLRGYLARALRKAIKMTLRIPVGSCSYVVCLEREFRTMHDCGMKLCFHESACVMNCDKATRF